MTKGESLEDELKGQEDNKEGDLKDVDNVDGDRDMMQEENGANKLG